MSTQKPGLLLLIEREPHEVERLASVMTVHDGTRGEHLPALLRDHGADIRAVLTIGTVAIAPEVMAALPGLEVVSCLGVGYEKVDLELLRKHRVRLTNGHGTNSRAVADHAMALLLATMRGIVDSDKCVRQGEWNKGRRVRPEVFGRRLGVLGLGDIGLAVARSCEGGFGMSVAYHNRSPRADVPYRYHSSVVELARDCDILVVAAPGGENTHHLIDAAVIDALGPDGFLVNISRGSLVDTPALVSALQAGRIAGAGLDVIENEPAVPPEVLALDNLVITPHVAGRSPRSEDAMLTRALDNFVAHFAGRPLTNVIFAP